MLYIKIIGCLSVMFCLTGCGSQDTASLVGSSPPDEGAFEIASLDANEVQLYRDGLKQIIVNPQTAKFLGVKALKFSIKDGVHVCGYVNHSNSEGLVKDVPFYVELRRDAGVSVVHRGQIGSDPAKLSKVKFVCRYHG